MMTNTRCLIKYTLYLFEVLVNLCLSTSPSCLLFSTLSCLRRLVSIDLSPRLLANRLPWGWREGWRRERERYVFPTFSCFVLWVCQRLCPLGQQLLLSGLLHGASTLWTSQSCQGLDALPVLTGFLHLPTSVETVPLLHALQLCHWSGILSSAGTLTDAE